MKAGTKLRNRQTSAIYTVVKHLPATKTLREILIYDCAFASIPDKQYRQAAFGFEVGFVLKGCDPA